MNVQPMLWEVAGVTMACDCPTCSERGLVVEVPDDRGRRCRVCGWLMRRTPDEDEQEAGEVRVDEMALHRLLVQFRRCIDHLEHQHTASVEAAHYWEDYVDQWQSEHLPPSAPDNPELDWIEGEKSYLADAEAAEQPDGGQDA